ncbi:MAG: gamma-glutamylcyclotransferase family protein [Trueperaceae bacterium]
MTDTKIWVFFYGSYINFNVLKEVDLVPEAWEVACLAGFDIQIAPRANLIRSAEHTVYGILATATHRELERLYIEHAHGKLGEIYLPEAVLVQSLDGKFRVAMTYICHEMEPRPAEDAYVERIAKPAREFGFPAWYIAKLEAFKS